MPSSSVLLAGCTTQTTFLEPRGPAAEPIVDLWWILFASTGIVTLVVFGLYAFALVRARRATRTDRAARIPGGETRFVVIAGAVVPAFILVGLTWATLNRGLAVVPRAEGEAVSIEVIGHQYWWEVRYPEADVVTANEIHLPVGRPLRITLRSIDVIHSFWAPELAGKLDLIPGRVNELWLQADSAGVYYGKCAEFCGLQHAKMAFLMIARPQDEFDAWLERQRQPAAVPRHPTLQEGQRLFVRADCVNCHAIRGFNDLPQGLGTPGPDLTHVGSRRTLAAVTVPNEAHWMAQWIFAPDQLKRGSRMPATRLHAEQLNALVAYLESLK